MTDPTYQSEIERIWQAIGDLQNNPQLPDHFHKGPDASRIFWSDLNQKKIYLTQTIYGADAAATANYSTFFIAPFPVLTTDFLEVHATAGTDGSAVTIQLEKLTGTTAPGSGLNILSAALSLKATANTVQTGVLTSTLANRSLAKSDRLALKRAGVLTSLANVTVIVGLTVI